ncbi:D-2-hydroxyacid dehydrogenase family protein [Alteribacter natronophilus]|uniref:D-2-hydroxyacid dehydrogenase family protein n=1 Tax=Alteribacter natronophilus TaxID=2583810 RepID=UPI00110D7BF6|nr:D-2-hydroxyacid dehydrogenase family protein [Alteribacter natronophilus]TMW71048.1 D-2-hydroxyacid dehydrogenase family protein [Alteribacter natronophilus]
MKLVILDDWEHLFSAHPRLEELKRHFDVHIYDDQPSHGTLISRIQDADIILPIRERTSFTKPVLESMKNVKLIAQTGGGLAHLDLEEATRLGIPVATTPGGSASVVELIFGLILSHARRLPRLDEEMKAGEWTESVGFGLEGKTVGIIGLGKIGSGVAKAAQAFGMNVIAWGPRLTEERARDKGVGYVSFETLLQNSHFIVTAVRLVPETRHLLKKEQFSLMRRDAFLVNTSRGEIVDEQALIEALETKRIAGAGLDVFAEEPLPSDNPLRKMDNVILTPHIGWKTDTIFNRFFTSAAENILSFFVEGKPIRIKNPEVLERKEKGDNR